ncbi:MAG TPA: hypothetical protein VGK58_23700, partial [Lacipirellulaceae bacterium]
IGLLRNLPAGVTELACHPGDGTRSDSTYCRERALEVEVLCDPRVKQTLLDENIRLCTFYDFAKTMAVSQPLQT